MRTLLLTGIFVILALNSSRASDLASQDAYCKVNEQHTACQYTGQNQKGVCEGIQKRGVSSDDIQKILDAHNSRRSKVANGQQSGQPAAANMIKLTWDSEAAAIAQLWMDQCDFSHDKSRETVKSGETVYNGQNIYMMSGGDEINFDDAVGAWYNEVALFSPSNIDPFTFDYPSGHYTQVVWATSARVGCGYVKDGESKHLFGCNYAPGGNMGGDAMYKTGEACSACPAGYEKCVDGLCSA